MKVYILKRLLFTVFAVWVALTLTFVLLTASPNPGLMRATMQCAAAGENPDKCREQFKQTRGLDEPFHERYKNYMINMATLNWGWSQSRQQYVTDAIAQSWLYTAQYGLPVLFLSTILGYSLGIWSAYKPYSVSDYFGSFVAFFGISIPNFWFGLVLIIIFSVRFNLLPVYYQSTIPTQQGWLSVANLKQLVLPIIVLMTASLAWLMRYSRAQCLEQKNQEFVKVAKAKGASQSRLMLKHVLRVAAVPLSTSFVGILLSVFWMGSVVIEQIFSIPGLGLLLFNSFTQQDTPLILAITLITVFLAVFGNLLEDLAYVWLDPRIDYSGR